ncbi:MAG: peptidoglycan DD-metalloendopeptidase family protein [Caulobacteraceae bacterium]|nr:peptidoglycan DD-metalloendopeptidase family protein [Caulobacteraceae bacterium]
MARFAHHAALACALAIGATAKAAPEPLAALNAREEAAEDREGRARNELSHLLGVLQQWRRDPPPALLVNPDDAKDAVRAAILVKALTPELQRRANLYAAQAEGVARQRRVSAAASEALFASESAFADEAPNPVSDVAGLRPRLAEPPAPPGPPPTPGSLLKPSAGPVTTPFGRTLVSGAPATGMTIRTAPGAPVRSPGRATVQYVGPARGLGVILILRMAGGYHLVLAGLDRATVGAGQSVAAGEPLGSMGDGRQSATDLYFEVRDQGRPTDPARWLAAGTGRPSGG